MLLRERGDGHEKFTAVVFSVLLILELTACGSANVQKDSAAEENDAQEYSAAEESNVQEDSAAKENNVQETEEDMMKVDDAAEAGEGSAKEDPEMENVTEAEEDSEAQSDAGAAGEGQQPGRAAYTGAWRGDRAGQPQL